MKKDINVKEKKIDILALWKAFWNPTAEEVTQEEEILSSNEITDAERKELLKALDSNEKLSNKMFRNSYKTTKLEVSDLKQSAKDSIATEQGNSDKTSTKTKKSKKNKDIAEQESKGMEIGD